MQEGEWRILVVCIALGGKVTDLVTRFCCAKLRRALTIADYDLRF
jgi:hypothetical protein